ncbi:hypothetical protein ABPG72_007237 [Tetrahymena utriculariae]
MNKKQFVIFSFILISINNILGSCPQIKPILTNLEYFSCELIQASQQEKRIAILSDQNSDLFSITFVGWYRLIGKSNQDYLLIQSRNGANQNLIKLVYNPVKMQIECTILKNIQIQDVSNQLKLYLQDKWFFLRIGINLQDKKAGQNSYIYYTIIYEQNRYITQSISQQSNFIIFDNSNFEYFYGSTSYFPYSRSCAVSKQVLAFLGIANDSSQGSLQGISQLELFLLPKLIFNLNLYMASSKFQLYNLNENNNYCQQLNDFKLPYYQFKIGQIIGFTNIINFQDSEGLIISLDAKVSQTDVNQFNTILQLASNNFNQYYQFEKYNVFYQLNIDSNSQIYDCFLNEIGNEVKSPRYQFQQDIWHKIVVIIQLKFNQIIRLLYLDGTLIDTFTLGNILKYQQMHLILYNYQQNPGNPSTRQIDFRNLKVYQGGFIYQCDDCLLKIYNSDCLFCSQKYLEEDKIFTCQTSCNSKFSNLSYSASLTCTFMPQKMCDDIINTGLDRFFQNECSCPKGQYFDQIQCQNCLYYCNSCQNANFCNKDDNQSYYVIGVKSPLFPFGQNLCGSLGSNNWIINGDYSMRSFVNVLFEFSEEDLTLILDFYFPDYKQNFQQHQLVIINKNDASIVLTMYPLQPNGLDFDQLQGIMFKNNFAKINLNQKLNKVPFVIKISLTANNYVNCLYFSYYLLKLVSKEKDIIIFRIGSQYLDNQYFLEVCTIQNCLKFPEVKFTCFAANILIIKVQQLKFSDSLAQIRCNVVLNYVQDQLDIELPQSLLSSPPTFYDIKLGNSTQLFNNPAIYYSQIQVYLGGFFFVNYDNQDPCFVYINRQNMICIYPKQAYALKNNNAIPQTDCNKNIQQNQQLQFYNKYTMTCQNSEIILPNCINIDISSKKCNQCIDSQMILTNNCSCPVGMFQDQSTQLCKQCSSLCKTCSINQDNCLECKGNDQIPPLCECKQKNYYQDSNQNCQECSVQCSSCIQNSDYCLTCSEGRINPPQCYCNPIIFLNTDSDPINNSCKRRNCPHKCQICDNNNQCQTCRGDRINPPNCLCGQGYYEDPIFQMQFCQTCNQGFYFSELLQKCVSLQVYKPFQFYIKASIKIQFSSNQYQIIIQFDYEIDLLENIINQLKVNNLFELQISQVNSTSYDIFKFSIAQNNKQLTLSINITENISETIAFFRFKQTSVFENKQFKYVVNPIYSQIPFQFNIGPYYLQTIMQNLLQNIDINQNIAIIASKFQVLFYILNSVQPTSMFILINIQKPPNFYQFLEKFSKLVFREVPETQSDQIQYGFTFFGIDVNDQVQPTRQDFLKKFGFSNSMIVNCQMIIFKYAVICLILFIIFCLQIKFKIEKLQTIFDFLVKRISIENEVNLLMIIISICLQFSEINQNESLQRWSFYIGTIMSIVFIYSNYWFFMVYNSENFEQNKNKLEIFYNRLKYEKNNSYLAKNIYFIFNFKKVFMVVSIYVFSDKPKIICISYSILNILTAFLIIYQRPYKYLVTSIIKSLGDLLLSSTWILMVLIQNFNFNNQNNVVINSNDVNHYLMLGYSASITLIAFNGLYLINQILEAIIMPLIEKIKQKRQIKKQQQLIHQTV